MDVRKEADRIMDYVDGAVDPSHMSAEEALLVLEELQGDIESRLDALRDEVNDPSD